MEKNGMENYIINLTLMKFMKLKMVEEWLNYIIMETN